MRKLLILSAFVALAFPALRAADDAGKAAKKLEGTYELVSAVRGGRPEGKAKDIESFTIKDGKITIKMKDKDQEKTAKFTIDPSQKPGHMDIMPEEDGKSETLKAIYETKDTDKGLELSLAFNRGDGDRPKDFKGESDDEMSLKLLRRKAK